MQPYISDLYWFCKEDVDMTKVKRYFTVDLSDNVAYDAEYDEEILECFRIDHRHGEPWVGLPKGQPSLVKSCLYDQNTWKSLVDKQSYVPIKKTSLKFNGEFRPEQVKAIKAMVKAGRGVLKSAPRTGKTVMGTQIAIDLGMKTLILAHQTDLIEQFCNETINDPTENLFNGRTLKKPVAGICRKLADFDKYDICLCTYQSFISKGGGKLLKKICKMFGTVIIDEVHRTPATRYSQVISRLWAPYILGLTATPDRKDGKYQVTNLLIGQIQHETKMKSLRASVYGRDTALMGVVTKNAPKTWNGMLSFLFRNAKRNQSITDTAYRDVKKGHVVLIPTVQKEHQQTLKAMLEKRLGKGAVFLFNGDIPKNKRQTSRDQMNKDTNIKVILATRSMLTGMNIPRLSAIYTVVPISNNPNYEQEVKRVCTPCEGKRPPVIRFFFDSTISMSHGCLKTCKKLLCEPNFKIHESFDLIGAGGRAKKQTSFDDDLEVARPAHGQRKKLF